MTGRARIARRGGARGRAGGAGWRPRHAWSTCAPPPRPAACTAAGRSASAVPDFFRQSAGPGSGFELGARLLVIDLSMSFLQLVDSNGLSGALMQALLGAEVDIPVGQPRLPNGQSINVLHAGVAGGAALGYGRAGELPDQQRAGRQTRVSCRASASATSCSLNPSHGRRRAARLRLPLLPGRPAHQRHGPRLRLPHHRPRPA